MSEPSVYSRYVRQRAGVTCNARRSARPAICSGVLYFTELYSTSMLLKDRQLNANCMWLFW